ncbi:hypothetical protein HBI62_234220 [Parastagonospora nodorum]|nr:hypothetical protein HBI62_234220 [Parastagonospora nodorum]KAH6157958.1 hypothetical protein HBI63_068900 [Parastagonospora nodorum]KAH6177437.1 hypothetical protein HBI61_122380 [Parastagonospora nodorum]
MSHTNILITGGCGFLGTSLISALLATNRYSITAIDITPPSLGTRTFPTTVRYVRADVLDPSALATVFAEAQPAIVIHAVGVFPVGVARYSMKGKDAVFKVNVEGTRNVVNAARECGARGLVYTSSTTVVVDDLANDFRNVDENWPAGNVDTSYGQSKALAEEAVLAANDEAFKTCVLRVAPMFGENDTLFIPTVHGLIAAGQTAFVIGTAENLQDFVYVGNAADAHVLAVANLLNSQTVAGEALFISNGEPISLRDLCLAIWKEFGHVPKYSVRIPEGMAWWIAVITEVAGWVTGIEGTLSRGVVSEACRDRYVSIVKAGRLLGYRPRVGLVEAVKISCEHYQKRIQSRSVVSRNAEEWR